MRCHNCGGRFGLIHHKILTFNGYLRFCTKECKRAYEKRIVMRCDAANSSGGFTQKAAPPDVVLLTETVSSAELGSLCFGIRESFFNM
jgi:hypothetical protein